MHLRAEPGVRGALEHDGERELVAPDAAAAHGPERPERLPGHGVVGVGGDERGPGNVARVRDFVEHRARGAREAASGVEGDEVVAAGGEEAGLEEVGVEVRPGEQRPRRAVAGEERADGLRGPHRGSIEPLPPPPFPVGGASQF